MGSWQLWLVFWRLGTEVPWAIRGSGEKGVESLFLRKRGWLEERCCMRLEIVELREEAGYSFGDGRDEVIDGWDLDVRRGWRGWKG